MTLDKFRSKQLTEHTYNSASNAEENEPPNQCIELIPFLTQEETLSDEIRPETLKLIQPYRSIPIFPDGILLLFFGLLIAIGTGIHFGSYALISFSFEDTFWSCVWLCLLLYGLFLNANVSNFPILFLVSLTTSVCALLVAHLYAFLTFRLIFITTPEGLNSDIWICIFNYLIKIQTTTGDQIRPRAILIEWPLILIQSIIFVSAGVLPPFSAFRMMDIDDRS